MSIRCIPLKPQSFDCPYLQGKISINENVIVKEMDNNDLEVLLRIGYRHFGEFFFRPICTDCRQCIPIRIPVQEFEPSKSVKRIFNRNKGFKVTLEKPVAKKEFFHLYIKHKYRFKEQTLDDYEHFISSFFHPFKFNRMLLVSDDNKLVSISHLDITTNAMSAVYCYFNEEYNRFSPGTFAVYKEIELAKELGIKWLYLGFYIEQNPHMNYKIRFKPNQLLLEGNNWTDYMDCSGKVIHPNALRLGFRPGYSPFFAR